MVVIRGGPHSGTAIAVATTRSHGKAPATQAVGRTSLLGTTAETATCSSGETSTCANGKNR